MRIDNTLPSFYTQVPQISVPERYSAPEPAASQGINAFSRQGLSFPGIVVDISPKGWEAYENSKATEGAGAAEKISGGKVTVGKSDAVSQECQTCKNRTYKDQSNDPSVSFQTATHISPGQAAATVLAHENEHVSHEQARADREGRRVISQSVSLETAFCPECGRMYVSGGTTRTITAEDSGKTQDGEK